jgi:hypothetical protein
VTDNAANQVLGVELTGHMWLPCAAHTLELAINDAFDSNPGIQLLLEDLQDIVAHIKRSSPSQRLLHSFQDQLKQPHYQVNTSNQVCTLQL